MSENRNSVGSNTMLLEMEAHANVFNLKCLAVLCGFSLLCGLCNIIGIFIVEAWMMRIAVGLSFMSFALPIIVWLIHDSFRKKTPSILQQSVFKYLIVFSVYFGIMVTCVTLTFHAILLMVLPGIFAAQYSDQKHLLKWILIGSVILVPLSVYGGLFFGVADRNFFAGIANKGHIALEERIDILTPKKYLDLLLHYVIPRLLSIIIIDILLSGISSRNASMLDKQKELSENVAFELRRRSELQCVVIANLSSLIESRDKSTGDHIHRSKNFFGQIVREMARDEAFKGRLNPELIAKMEIVAPLHDIGKINVPDAILLKPGKLTPEEFEIIKLHTTKGGAMIRNLFSNLDDPLLLRLAEDIAVYHHERWDGGGYPEGKEGEEIPLAARIMAVADVYDALVSDRVYKKAIPREEALQIIYSESGTHFDPEIIRILKQIEYS